MKPCKCTVYTVHHEISYLCHLQTELSNKLRGPPVSDVGPSFLFSQENNVET